MAVLSGLRWGCVLKTDVWYRVGSHPISPRNTCDTHRSCCTAPPRLLGPAVVAAQNPKTQPRTHTPQPTSAAITAADLKTRLYIFAADSMEGRETGTRGHIKATNYIDAELKKLGLKPMGDNGTFFQTVPVIRRSLDPSSTLTAGDVVLKAGTDFVAVGGRGGNVAAVPSAPVVFGGMSGDSSGALSADQTRGKIVLLRQAANAGRGGGRGGRGGGRGGFGRGGAARRVRWRRSPWSMSSRRRRSTARCIREKARCSSSRRPSDSSTAPTITMTRHAAEQLLGGSLDGMQKGQAGKTLAVESQVHRQRRAGAQRRRRVHRQRSEAQGRVGRVGSAQRSRGHSCRRSGGSRLAASVRAGVVSDSRTHRAVQSRESHLRRTSADRHATPRRPSSKRTSISSTSRSRRSTSISTACGKRTAAFAPTRSTTAPTTTDQAA